MFPIRQLFLYYNKIIPMYSIVQWTIYANINLNITGERNTKY